jgi:hypothetical protein
VTFLCVYQLSVLSYFSTRAYFDRLCTLLDAYGFILSVARGYHVCHIFILFDDIVIFMMIDTTWICEYIMLISIIIFSSPDPNGHANYCHHLSSVQRNIFQNLPWIYTTNFNQSRTLPSLVLTFYIVSNDTANKPILSP